MRSVVVCDINSEFWLLLPAYMGISWCRGELAPVPLGFGRLVTTVTILLGTLRTKLKRRTDNNEPSNKLGLGLGLTLTTTTTNAAEKPTPTPTPNPEPYQQKEHFRFAASNAAIAGVTVDLFVSLVPSKALQSAARWGVYALIDPPLLKAFGFPTVGSFFWVLEGGSK